MCTGDGEAEHTTSSGGDQDPQEVCALASDPGGCSIISTRYYFQPQTGACQPFQYSGCQGNENNFHTEQDCHDFCKDVMLSASSLFPISPPMRPASTTTSSTVETVSLILDSTTTTTTTTEYHDDVDGSVCSLNADKGTCSGDITRYHYVPELENCVSFIFTGCGVSFNKIFLIKHNCLYQGNKNNFETISECFKACHPDEEDLYPQPTSSGDNQPTEKDSGEDGDGDFLFPLLMPFNLKPDNGPGTVCDLMKDPGPCHPLDPARFLRRYFYNISTGQCEMFLYGGCGGNHNNFENKTDCETFCDPYNQTNPAILSLSEKPGLAWNESYCVMSPRHGNCHDLEPR